MFDMTLGNLLILFLTIVFGFYMAWTIGANDVANSMGTVFGSRTLSLKRIIMIAVVFEFLGAFLVGAHVTKTLKAGIVDPAPFQDPALFPGDQGIYIFIAGMLAVLLAASLWVTLATYWKLPISTSQSIVGAVAGFGIISIFLGDIPSKALSLGTLAKISTGWILSPVFGGMVSFLIFLSIKKMVFESGDIESRANKANHLFVFLVVFILLLAGLSGGLKNLRSVVASILPGTLLDTIFDHFLLKALVILVISVIITFIFFILTRKKRRASGKARSPLERVEGMFGGLLVLTACYVAFAHGANDVANAIGPVAGIVQILVKGEISGTVAVPTWILLLGGLGIVVGVSTWGYRVMETIGKRITKITPTRGFSASFGAASSVLICSLLGIPVSTSQIIVGSVIGVGMAGGIAAIDLRVIRSILVSWIFTVPVSAITTGLIYLLFRAITLQLA